MNAMTGKRMHFDDDGVKEDEGHAEKKQLLVSKSKKLSGELPKLKHDKFDKFMNLLIAIGDVLEDDGFEEVAEIAPPDALTQCVQLRNLFLAQAKRDPSIFKNPPDRECRLLKAYNTTGVPSTLSSLTPWRSPEIPSQLPILPKILDKTLEVATFTHQGMGSGRVTDLSYERLEWVGDSYLYVTATILISKTFPSLLPGKCSQLRERLIKNVTLADYARQYHFDKLASIPKEIVENSKHAAKDQNFTKIMGDIFEAYVAAVIISDKTYGASRAMAWLKQLWSMTLKKEIINEEKSGMNYDSPMWNLRGNIDKVEVAEATPVKLGYKEQLQKLLGSKGMKLTYKDAAPEKTDRSNKLPLFTVGVYLDGYGYKNKQLGYGTANGKKDAGNRAAAMALASRTLMKELAEKKKVHDARLEQERLALEAIGNR